MKAVLDGLSLGLTDRDSLVRFQAITGIADAGKDAARRLRSALPARVRSHKPGGLVETLGTLKDAVSVPLFVEILKDTGRAEPVRMAALVALRPVPRPAVAAPRCRWCIGKRRRHWWPRRCPIWLAGYLPANDLARSCKMPPRK